MKRLIPLCAAALLCAYAHGQQINPNQIQPGTSNQCLVTVAGVSTWTTCPGGGGSVGPGTVNFIPKFTPSTTTIGNSACDDGVTNAGIMTCAEPIASQSTHQGAWYGGVGSGTVPTPTPAAWVGWIAPTSGAPNFFYQLPTGTPSGNSVMAFGTPSTVNGQSQSAATLFALQGTDTKILTSGTISGTAATLCTDANGGATTTGCSSGSSGLSGMTSGQVPIAATATTVTSSKALAGTGAGITTGPTSSTLHDCAYYTDTAGTTGDSGAPCSGGGGSLPSGVNGQIATNNGSGATNYSAQSPTIGVANGGASITTSYTLLCDSATVATGIQDRGRWAIVGSGGSVTLPDLAGTGCSGMYGGVLNSTTSTVTVSRQTSDTLNCYVPGSAPSTGQTSCTIPEGSWAMFSPNVISATAYDVKIAPAPGGSGGNFVLIQDQTLGSAAATVTFSSIPNTYKHLYLEITTRCSAASSFDFLTIQANTDTGSNYSIQGMNANNSSVAAFEDPPTPPGTPATAKTVGMPCASALTGAASAITIDIPTYAGTTFTKSALLHAGGILGAASASNMFEYYIYWNWNSTAAINQLIFAVAGGSNFVAGSEFTLYGKN